MEDEVKLSSNQLPQPQHQFSPSTYHFHQQRNGHSRISLHSDSNHPRPPQNRIAELQEEYLIPMKEDLSDWLKVILNIDDLDSNNFMSRLDNGVIVCKLAKLLEEKCNIEETLITPRDIPNSANFSPSNTSSNRSTSNHSNGHHNNTTTTTNNNNLLNDIKSNLTHGDHKSSSNLNSVNNNNIIYEESISNDGKSNGDQGHYRSTTFNHNGRRLSFNYNGSLNGHSPINGSSSSLSSSSSSSQFSGSSSNGISARTMKCWENAKSETFYARDNVSNFIKWCRKLNVRECVLFESEDLVLHNNPKNVVLCLLEVARIACKKFMFLPAPGLVQFEQEIDAEEKAELERERLKRRKRQLLESTMSKTTSSNKPLSTTTTINNNVISEKSESNKCNSDDNVSVKNNRNSSEDNNNNTNGDDNNINGNNDNGNLLLIGYEGDDDEGEEEEEEEDDEEKCLERPDSVGTTSGSGQSSSDSINNGDVDGVDGWSSVSQENLGRASSVTSISSTSAESTETQSSQAPFGQESEKVVSQLDQKVMLIAKSYYGKKAKHGIQRLAEGKYRIAGKIVFVRLLKDRHVMVRVGGGWDTLQHFLERHGNGSDPVKEISPSDLLPMDTRPSESMSRRRNSQSSQQSVPSTPILRRCLSSTPVSRSSLSSPEPWTSVGNSNAYVNTTGGSPNGVLSSSSSTTSGYNGITNGCSPYGSRSLARRSSACTTLSNITTASSSTTHSSSTSSSSSTLNSTEKCVSPVSTSASVTSSSPNSSVHHSIPRRRSLAYDGFSNLRNSTIKSNRSMLSLNLTRSPSTSSHLNSSFSSSRQFNNSSGNLINLSNNTNSTATNTKTSRYPNYLQSSQHITSRIPINSHHTKSPLAPSSAKSTVTTSSVTSPTTPTSGAAPLRRASLKAF